MLKKSKIFYVAIKRSWRVKVRYRPKICLKNVFSSWNTTSKGPALNEKRCHMHQNLASKNDGSTEKILIQGCHTCQIFLTFPRHFFKALWPSLAFTKVNKYWQTRETIKEVSDQQLDNFKHCKNYLSEKGMM